MYRNEKRNFLRVFICPMRTPQFNFIRIIFIYKEPKAHKTFFKRRALGTRFLQLSSLILVFQKNLLNFFSVYSTAPWFLMQTRVHAPYQIIRLYFLKTTYLVYVKHTPVSFVQFRTNNTWSSLIKMSANVLHNSTKYESERRKTNMNHDVSDSIFRNFHHLSDHTLQTFVIAFI